MQTLRIGNSNLEGSRLTYGCMRLAGDGSAVALENGRRAVRTALDAGYTVFDHADIYGDGQCETLFGDVIRESPGLRDRLILQTKCGVRLPTETTPAHYDLSSQHILDSVDGSLRRLNVEFIDIFLLHRPDPLMDPEDIASACDKLHRAGKVRHFGVSNFSVSQLSLLSTYVDRPLLTNQIELNLHTVDALSDGTLDQCRRLGITPQAWSPLAGFAFPAWQNRFTTEQSERVRREVEQQATKYAVEPWLIPIAWLLRHPSGIVPIVGSTTPERVTSAVSAFDIPFDRVDWYRLLEARNGQPVP